MSPQCPIRPTTVADICGCAARECEALGTETPHPPTSSQGPRSLGYQWTSVKTPCLEDSGEHRVVFITESKVFLPGAPQQPCGCWLSLTASSRLVRTTHQTRAPDRPCPWQPSAELGLLTHHVCVLFVPSDHSHCGFENSLLHLKFCLEQSVTKTE